MKSSYKKIFLVLAGLVAFVGIAQSNTLTTNYNLNKPAVNDAQDQDIWGDLLNDNFDVIDTQLKTNADAIAATGAVPVGSILHYAGSTAPSGWLLAYGQSIGDVSSGADVEDADLDTLFDIVKVAYGNTGSEVFGNGDTVDLPDCRGRIMAGQDDMGGVSANRLTDQSGGLDGDTLGDTGGAEEHTLTIAEMPSHNHPGTYNTAASAGSQNRIGKLYDGSTASGNVNSQGGGGAHNNVQPTIIVNCMIYAGI